MPVIVWSEVLVTKSVALAPVSEPISTPDTVNEEAILSSVTTNAPPLAELPAKSLCTTVNLLAPSFKSLPSANCAEPEAASVLVREWVASM